MEGWDRSESVFGLTASSISQKIHQWAVKAGVHIHTHSLRVSFATSIDEHGVSQAVLQDLMGHSNPATTKRYIRLRDERKRAAVNALDEKDEPDEIEQPPTKLPKLVQAAPRDKMEVFISDPGQKLYIDDDGNIFEV